MSDQELVKIGHENIDQIVKQLEDNLELLNQEDKLRAPVQKTLDELKTISTAGELATPYDKSVLIANTLNFLRLAVSQRHQISKQFSWLEKLILQLFPKIGALAQPQNDNYQYLDTIDGLIQSCYKPVASVVGNRLKFQPQDILAVYFEGEYLSRPNAPVPFLLVPSFYEGNKPEAWIAVGHETGHHVYRQVPDLQYEVEIVVTQALLKASITQTQQRLWFNWLDETFADVYGILTLGAASVYALQVIIRNYASPDLEGLLKSTDTAHPIPLVRGVMAIQIYRQLLGGSTSNDLTVLQAQWKETTDRLAGRPLLDPHTPKTPSLADNWNGSGKLDYTETINVMELVINTLLTSELHSLGCKCLSELVNFQADENLRQQQRSLRPIEPDPNTDIRFWVAAQQLAQYEQ